MLFVLGKENKMKIVLGYTKYTEETFVLPKKFEFLFKKDEYEWTDDEWDLLEDFHKWKLKITDCDYNMDVDIIDIIDTI